MIHFRGFMRELLGKTKVIVDNFKLLHHNMVGLGWQSDHPKFAEYYEKVTEFEDEISEMLILLGERDMNIGEAVEYYSPIHAKKYNIRDCYSLAMCYFGDLLEVGLKYRDSLPPDCQSKLDEYLYYFRKEAYFKIKNTLL